MNLQIELTEGHFADECLITNVEPNESKLIEPEGFCNISLELFPRVCGVTRVSGLVILDTLADKEYDFYTKPFAHLVAEY
jgi:hypothetical protein